MQEDDYTRHSRSWFYVMAGALCSLLFVNLAIADLISIIIMWQSSSR